MTAAARDEQRKMIKYNHLVANLLDFHTAVGMTRALENMAADGFADAISPEALTMSAPTRPSTSTGSATMCSTCRARPRRFPSPCRSDGHHGVRRPPPMCEDLVRILAMAH